MCTETAGGSVTLFDRCSIQVPAYIGTLYEGRLCLLNGNSATCSRHSMICLSGQGRVESSSDPHRETLRAACL